MKTEILLKNCSLFQMAGRKKAVFRIYSEAPCIFESELPENNMDRHKIFKFAMALNFLRAKTHILGNKMPADCVKIGHLLN